MTNSNTAGPIVWARSTVEREYAKIRDTAVPFNATNENCNQK